MCDVAHRFSVIFCQPVPTWKFVVNSTNNDFESVVEYQCRANEAFPDDEAREGIRKIAYCNTYKEWEPPYVDCICAFHFLTSEKVM